MAVETTSTTLPDDLSAAHQLITSLREQLGKSQNENAWLRHRLDVLSRRLFGKKTEQLSPDQLALAFEQLANEPGGVSEPVETDSGEGSRPEKPRLRRGRRALPKELPRQIVIVDVPEGEKTCASCGIDKEKIGEEIAEKYDFIPASLFVQRTVRPKYSCPKCHEGVVTAKAPEQAVEKGLAAEGLLAYVVTSKYVDHLPLYRLERILARHGAELSRTTLCDQVASCAAALGPIYERIRTQLMTVDYLQTDDTPVTVLEKGGGSFTGRLWVYVDPLSANVVFDATASRSRDGPETVLKSFEGYLQADAYSAYDALFRSGVIVEVACWAHVRRKFFEAKEADPESLKMLALIRKLYEVERDAKGLEPEERLRLRRERSARILDEIDRLRADLVRTALPKSGLGVALGYLDNQRHALGRFLEDGRLRLDNNGAENELRVVALGRKNWMFAGSMEGARRAAVLYTLAQGCKRAGVDPYLYFRDVLLRVSTHPSSRIDELTPAGWAAARKQSAAA